MSMRTRKQIGVLLAVLAPVVFVALALGGIQTITISSVHFEDTGATVSRVHLHWPLLIPAAMLIAAIALMLVAGQGKQVSGQGTLRA
jgi:hypothetical protein